MTPRRKEPAPPGTLLTWHSRNHHLDVLRNALTQLRSKGCDVRRVIYLCQEPKDGRDAVEIADELRVEIDPLTVKLGPYGITQHQVLSDALEEQVVPIVGEEAALHINISPGTPAMHAVWLLLHARGSFPQGTRLWSTQQEKGGAVRIDEVAFSVNTYLQQIRRVQEAEPDLAHFDLQPRSERRKQAHEQLLRYGRIKQAPLLVVGERGTGKTRLLEDRMPQIKGRERVITVACGTLKPELAMSQLFGHLKGAFTGATENQVGYIKEANGKILLLDEVQDLPKEVQRQLVRVLQDPKRRYRKLGSMAEETANVEVVCASHLRLEELRQRLDGDLFDRLSLLIIEWPALRECREDLRMDFRQVWRELCTDAELGREPPAEPALWEVLTQDDLPGNIRDLQRLTYLLMTRHGRPRWVHEALGEWQRLQRRLQAAEQGHGVRRTLDEMQSQSWKEHTHHFQRELALDARELLGSYESAAKALKTSEKTVRSAVGRASSKEKEP